MKVWLQTRGVTHDYAFLGAAPPDYWWTIPLYKDATSFEQPTLILERVQGDQWRCFISAIPSARRDCVNTRIRYSMALHGQGDTDLATFLNLLAYVLDIFRNNPILENNPLTRLLDDKVDNHADEWLAGNVEESVTNTDELGKLFTKLEARTIDPQKLRRELSDILNDALDSAKVAAILNLVGKDRDSWKDHFQSRLLPSQGKVLILGSPVAGEKIEKFFFVTSQKRSTSTGNVGVTGQSSDAAIQKIGDSLRCYGDRLLSRAKTKLIGNGTINEGFAQGPQVRNQTTEGQGSIKKLQCFIKHIIDRYGLRKVLFVVVIILILLSVGIYSISK